MTGGTVKQFLEALEEMRTIYKFVDERTQISTRDSMVNAHNCLTIVTTDENTGVVIEMTKRIPRKE